MMLSRPVFLLLLVPILVGAAALAVAHLPPGDDGSSDVVWSDTWECKEHYSKFTYAQFCVGGGGCNDSCLYPVCLHCQDGSHRHCETDSDGDTTCWDERHGDYRNRFGGCDDFAYCLLGESDGEECKEGLFDKWMEVDFPNTMEALEFGEWPAGYERDSEHEESETTCTGKDYPDPVLMDQIDLKLTPLPVIELHDPKLLTPSPELVGVVGPEMLAFEEAGDGKVNVGIPGVVFADPESWDEDGRTHMASSIREADLGHPVLSHLGQVAQLLATRTPAVPVGVPGSPSVVLDTPHDIPGVIPVEDASPVLTGVQRVTNTRMRLGVSGQGTDPVEYRFWPYNGLIPSPVLVEYEPLDASGEVDVLLIELVYSFQVRTHVPGEEPSVGSWVRNQLAGISGLPPLSGDEGAPFLESAVVVVDDTTDPENPAYKVRLKVSGPGSDTACYRHWPYNGMIPSPVLVPYKWRWNPDIPHGDIHIPGIEVPHSFQVRASCSDPDSPASRVLNIRVGDPLYLSSVASPHVTPVIMRTPTPYPTLEGGGVRPPRPSVTQFVQKPKFAGIGVVHVSGVVSGYRLEYRWWDYNALTPSRVLEDWKPAPALSGGKFEVPYLDIIEYPKGPNVPYLDILEYPNVPNVLPIHLSRQIGYTDSRQVSLQIRQVSGGVSSQPSLVSNLRIWGGNPWVWGGALYGGEWNVAE